MRKKSFNRLFMVALLFGGYLCATAPLQAQQIDNNLSDESLDLNFRKVDPIAFNGSSYTIDGESLRNMPVTHLANLLSGLIPGFYSRQSSGSVINEQPSYWIRGRRTTSEGVLVLVDGQERLFGSLSSFEVEKITVLKDAAAVALYGMRAANGAILVTTRRGEKGKPKIELSTQLINQLPLKVPTPVNASNYANYYNQAYMNDNQNETPFYTDPNIYKGSSSMQLYPDVDWYGKLYDQNQFMQRYNLNVSGGTNLTRYFVNLGVMTHEGMFNTDESHTYSTDSEFGRYNLRSNFEVDVTPTTLLTADIYGWYETQNRPNNSTINSFTALLNTPANAFPMYFVDNGKYKDQSGQQITGRNGKILTQNADFSNPWTTVNENGYAQYTEIYGSFRVKLNQDLSMLLPGLNISGDLSMDSEASWVADRTKGNAYYELLNDSTMKKTGTDGTMSNSVSGKSSNRSLSLNLQIAYNRQFDKHAVSALAFYTQYENANDISIPDRQQGINGWIGYNYDKRYGIDFLASWYGSYKFAKGKRFGFFPTVSGGWTISNESFFEEAKDIVNHLKIRASIGQLGSERGVSAHQFMSALTQQSNVYYFGSTMGSVGGYLETQVANPNVTWEKALILNAAIEGRFFNDQLNFVAEYFKDNRSDIYRVNQNIGGLYGIEGDFKENIGSMYSQGTEIGIQWNSKTGNISYNIGGTYSYSQNKVTDFGEPEESYDWLTDAGYPVGVIRGLVADGYFNNWDEIRNSPVKYTYGTVQPGDVKYVDLNGDNVIDANDIKPIGLAETPNHFFGLNIGAEYKGFGFTVLFQGAAGTSRNLTGIYGYPFSDKGTIFEHQLDYWTPENPNAEFPRLSLNTSNNNARNSTLWVRDASYLRLKTAQIYYSLPKSICNEHTIIKGVQLYLSGYNLLTWDKLNFMDPEWDKSTFPVTRNISVGCTIKI